MTDKTDAHFLKDGKGPDLLLLHGWQDGKETWRPIIDYLKGDFTCWAPDLPGFGESSQTTVGTNIQDYARWVESFTKLNKIDKFYLLGHSFGGRISIEVAASSYKVEKLILYGTPIFNDDSTKLKFSKFVSRNLKVKNVPFFSNLLRSGDYRHAEGALREVLINALNYNPVLRLNKIDAQTLLIWGERDEEVSVDTAYKAKSLIGKSIIEILPRLGHFAHLANPNLFAGKVRTFLKK